MSDRMMGDNVLGDDNKFRSGSRFLYLALSRLPRTRRGYRPGSFFS